MKHFFRLFTFQSKTYFKVAAKKACISKRLLNTKKIVNAVCDFYLNLWTYFNKNYDFRENSKCSRLLSFSVESQELRSVDFEVPVEVFEIQEHTDVEEFC